VTYEFGAGIVSQLKPAYPQIFIALQCKSKPLIELKVAINKRCVENDPFLSLSLNLQHAVKNHIKSCNLAKHMHHLNSNHLTD
jgi:hypothetical protein